MNQLFKITALLISGLLITSCSMFGKDTPALYQSNVKSAPPLVMPNNFIKSTQEDYYPIPELASPPSNTKVSILPPGSSLNPSSANKKSSK